MSPIHLLLRARHALETAYPDLSYPWLESDGTHEESLELQRIAVIVEAARTSERK